MGESYSDFELSLAFFACLRFRFEEKVKRKFFSFFFRVFLVLHFLEFGMVVSPRFLGKMGERVWCTEWGPSLLSLSQVSFAEWHPPLGFFGLFWWLSFCKMFCKLEAWEGEWGTWNCRIRAAYFVRDCFCDSDIWWLPFCSWHFFFTDKASHSVPMFASIFGGGPHFAADLCARWLPTTSNANFNGYTMTCSCSLSGEIAPPKATQGRKTGTQGQAQGQHAPRGQLHVGRPFLLTCGKNYRLSLRDFVRISQVLSVPNSWVGQ